MTKGIDEKILKKFYGVCSDPAKLEELNKEELVMINELTERHLEELSAQRVAIRAELLDKIEDDGEVINQKTYTKIKIYNFDVDLERARDMGATKIIPEKEVVNKLTLKKLVINGVKIKHEIVERLMIREVREVREVREK